MDNTKEKSAVGMGVPATDTENHFNSIISDSDGKIKMLDIIKLKHHPDNPRKNIGDITELTDSIRKNGVMQNLTVIPEDDMYLVLIGNRRFEAAVAAGLTRLPCKIVTGLTPAQQLGIMLEENMQRNDLTVIEQAQGFQLMLDFGETVKTVSEKTGFSEKTVKHRLNINLLNQDILKKKNEEFQLSMTDLMALEKIEDINERDKVLKSATSSDNLRCAIDRAVTNELKDKVKAAVISTIEEKGIPFDKSAAYSLYGDTWITIGKFSIWNVPLSKVTITYIPTIRNIKVKADMVYTETYDGILVLEKNKSVKKKPPKSEAYIRIEKNRDKVHETVKKMVRQMWVFVHMRATECGHDVGNFRHCNRDTRWIWDTLVLADTSVYQRTLQEIFLQKDWFESSDEEKRNAQIKLRRVPVELQMLYCLVKRLETAQMPYEYSTGKYQEKYAELFSTTYHLLKGFGFSFAEDDVNLYESILDGSSDLYMKDGETHA